MKYGIDEIVTMTHDLSDEFYRRGIPFSSIYADIPNGRIVVELTQRAYDQASATPPLANRIAQEQVDLRIVESATTGYYTKHDTLPNMWVEGGQAINWQGNLDPSSYACTSGFAVDSAQFGSFVLTAGHCAVGVPTTTWTQGIYNLGTASAINHSGLFDAMAISTTSVRTNRGRFHQTSTLWQQPITFQVQASHDIFGQTFCQTGRTWTGSHGTTNAATQCGTVSSLWAVGASGAGYGPYHPNFVHVSGMGGAGGDSGPVVYWPTIYGPGGAGLIQGGPTTQPNPPWTLVTKIHSVTIAWGLTLTPA